MLIEEGGSLDDEGQFMQREIRLSRLFDALEFFEGVFEAGREGLNGLAGQVADGHGTAPGW